MQLFLGLLYAFHIYLNSKLHTEFGGTLTLTLCKDAQDYVATLFTHDDMLSHESMIVVTHRPIHQPVQSILGGEINGERRS